MKDSETIRVLVVDDHPALREGIVSIVGRQTDMVVVAQASTAAEGIQKYGQIRPDITLMDLRLPDQSGIDALITIRAEFPAARIIMLTTFEGDAEVHRALESGARGYLLKSTPIESLVEEIRHVHAGKTRVGPEAASQVAEHLGDEKLSARECDVLFRIASGKRNSDIAKVLSISEGTVKVHIRNIMGKLGARDRSHAIAIAIRRGIIQL